MNWKSEKNRSRAIIWWWSGGGNRAGMGTHATKPNNVLDKEKSSSRSGCWKSWQSLKNWKLEMPEKSRLAFQFLPWMAGWMVVHIVREDANISVGKLENWGFDLSITRLVLAAYAGLPAVCFAGKGPRWNPTWAAIFSMCVMTTETQNTWVGKENSLVIFTTSSTAGVSLQRLPPTCRPTGHHEKRADNLSKQQVIP